ncbi:{NirD} Ferredoxin subunits of nitrite reductase and ring-hydroxylating dioxygenases [actinobacterium SCGC AAA044-D11]|jgi:3-phenylpropionate/trans-cinnamate dioxygenase ferredoxin subunit
MSELSFDSLVERKPVKIDLNGTPVCVTRIGDEVFAIADTCSHSEASLSEGDVTDYKIECWLHGAEFDLRSGEVVTPPASIPVEVFDVIREGDTIKISSRKSAQG